MRIPDHDERVRPYEAYGISLGRCTRCGCIKKINFTLVRVQGVCVCVHRAHAAGIKQTHTHTHSRPLTRMHCGLVEEGRDSERKWSDPQISIRRCNKYICTHIRHTDTHTHTQTIHCLARRWKPKKCTCKYLLFAVRRNVCVCGTSTPKWNQCIRVFADN